MSLSPGTRLGAYEIVSALGAGGMGVVYRALDTNLNRPVAIKVLSEQVTAGTSEEAGIEFFPDGRSFLTSIGTRHRTLWDGKHMAVWVAGATEETAHAVMVYPVAGGSPTMVCGACAFRDPEFPQSVGWSPDGRLLYLAIWGQATYAVPLRPGQVVPLLPASGIRSAEDAAAVPGARAFPVPGAFAGPDPSVYAYSKVSAQRNIYRVVLQ